MVLSVPVAVALNRLQRRLSLRGGGGLMTDHTVGAAGPGPLGEAADRGAATRISGRRTGAGCSVRHLVLVVLALLTILPVIL